MFAGGATLRSLSKALIRTTNLSFFAAAFSCLCGRLVTAKRLPSGARSKLRCHQYYSLRRNERNGRNSDKPLIQRYLHWERDTTLRAGLEKTYPWIEDQYLARRRGEAGRARSRSVALIAVNGIGRRSDGTDYPLRAGRIKNNSFCASRSANFEHAESITCGPG